MKKLVLLFVLAFASIAFAQSKEVVLATTIANSTAKTFYVPLYKYMDQGIVDSVSLTIYYQGVIKDSTLTLVRGITKNLPTYTTSSTTSKSNYPLEYFSSTVDTTITPGITNTTYTYTRSIYKWKKGLYTTGTAQKTYLDGFNAIKGVFLTKATGNTATANTQLLTIVANIYWRKN